MDSNTKCPDVPCSWFRFLFSWRVDSLVGLVDVLDGQDGQVAVIAEVSQGDPLAGLQAKLVNLGLGKIEGDGHGEKNAILEAVLLDNSVERIFCQSVMFCLQQFFDMFPE